MKKLILIILTLSFYACSDLQPNEPYLLSFKQEKYSEYISELGIGCRDSLIEKKQISTRTWRFKYMLNMGGGMCEKNFTGYLITRRNTITLFADYIFNEPEYKDVFVEVPVNNCTSIFHFMVSGIEDIEHYNFVFENEICNLPK